MLKLADMRKTVFLTTNYFESSLKPLFAPRSLQIAVPVVTSAIFSSSYLLLAINGNIYSFDYEDGTWHKILETGEKLERVFAEYCCYSDDFSCISVSFMVLAYSIGLPPGNTAVYISRSLGLHFDRLNITQMGHIQATVEGFFYFHSMSKYAVLLKFGKVGRFLYTNFPEEESLGLPFFMDGSYRITNLPGLKGFLIFWNENNIQFSHNSGQLVGPIIVKKNMQFLYPSISQMGMKIYTIASYDNELAILTENGRFFYGTLGLLSTSIFEVTPEDIDINNTALMFIGVGFIFVVTPIKDPVFQAYDFHICIINIQKLLQQSEIGLKTCKAELLQGNFDKTMHILDMSDTLHLYGVMVPQPTQNPIPIITISNPHSLGLKLKMYEDGYTYDGNIKFKINITLMQQYLSGKAHDSFISNIKVPSLSTITLDLIDRGLSCIDLQPPTGLISIGCNWAKKIIIRNTLNACTKDILTPVELQKNYTYILEKGTYDPSFNSRLRLDLQDQAVIYDYEELGCPQLVYFNNPWKPVIELWEGSRFVEVVTTEFVLMEKNGMHTYNYSKNVGGANCKSQAQNWTSVMAASTTKNYLAWTREIYVTCHELNHSIPLLWPDLEYQILGGRTDNSIIFQERNGFYIFHLTIVDPFYSYCDLTTSFAIYVYGAFPQRLLPDYPLALLVMLSMLFILWLGYVIPKLSSTEKGRVIIGFFQELWNPFMKREKRKRPSHR
ncbi:cation channel sperm-associated auxiliary subunit delta isoform X4 [Monodelphis domestica]|uniref:cation channel sperm-associated auxiliary subunit delta isoform X4 n=1 Tax=Monodelphis domestica TaxID=13616 RepID=UPI0024E2649A|nr:cation channel sperm-associated auxiliary subunit delta isoform X4 [Monodelphis domestica]XP_056678476.1 cation channel sperm-associated auxiliary subunit delta isoform X4 [Monodelphis domestica]